MYGFFIKLAKNEAIESVPAAVIAIYPHYLEVRHTARGRSVRVAYDDMWFKPQCSLSAELLSCSLEDKLAKPMEPVEAAKFIANATRLPDTPPPQPRTPIPPRSTQQSLLATV